MQSFALRFAEYRHRYEKQGVDSNIGLPFPCRNKRICYWRVQNSRQKCFVILNRQRPNTRKGLVACHAFVVRERSHSPCSPTPSRFIEDGLRLVPSVLPSMPSLVFLP